MGLVPYLIGFHPEESLVALVIEDGRVVVTARVDLAAVREPWALADLVARLFERYPSAMGWFLAYTDNEEVAWDVLASCAGLVGAVRLGRLIQVGGRAWRADAPDGPTGSVAGRVSTVAAEATMLGLPARASRRDLLAGVAGPPDDEVDDLVARFAAEEPALEQLGVRGRRRLLSRLLRAATPPSVTDCVRLALLAGRAEGQLAALRDLSQKNAEHRLELWTRVVRHCLVAHQPGPLGLLGMAAWQTGDGALQMVCLERLDRIDPLAPIAALLDWLNFEVLPPWEWARRREVLLKSMADQFAVLEHCGRPDD